MDIQSIRKILFPAINNAIQEMEEQNLNCNITLLKRIVNEAIDGSLNRNHSNLSTIIADFSGRGRAWAKVNVDENNPVWNTIKLVLQEEMNSGTNNSDVYMRCSGMIDLFENTGIAWMRFSGVNSKSKVIRFQLRVWGSKLEDHIKIRIDSNDYKYISNLEGVPHNLNLESGNFLDDEIRSKEIINIPVSSNDLKELGIQSLEDILAEG
mgnify:CR=1 FL=1|tara:strand:+ start:179 stop:805 length:627 start_codon:yes stop_codon:yes gene_type:complete